MHKETQDVKGPADVHFADASKHVGRYMEEGKLDVVTPADFYKSLNPGDGMKGCIAELYEVNMEHDEARKWSEAFKGPGDEGSSVRLDDSTISGTLMKTVTAKMSTLIHTCTSIAHQYAGC